MVILQTYRNTGTSVNSAATIYIDKNTGQIS
jgi:hypothetical protein